MRTAKTAKTLILSLTLLGLAFAAAAAPPPVDRSYLVSFLFPGEDGGEPELQVDCWSFTDGQFCSESVGACGPMTLVEVAGEPTARPAFTALVSYATDDGTEVIARLRGFAERRGQPSTSLGGVAVLTAPAIHESVNFAFSGVEEPSCSLPAAAGPRHAEPSPRTGRPD